MRRAGPAGTAPEGSGWAGPWLARARQWGAPAPRGGALARGRWPPISPDSQSTVSIAVTSAGRGGARSGDSGPRPHPPLIRGARHRQHLRHRQHRHHRRNLQQHQVRPVRPSEAIPASLWATVPQFCPAAASPSARPRERCRCAGSGGGDSPSPPLCLCQPRSAMPHPCLCSVFDRGLGGEMARIWYFTAELIAFFFLLFFFWRKEGSEGTLSLSTTP